MSTSQHVASGWDVLRLSLHVLAATIWVGGQFVLAGLVPTVRTFGDEAPKKIAQAFGRLSWPAFWLLVLTGLWNYAAVHGAHPTTTWNMLFGIKMLCVVIAGLGAYAHTKATNAAQRGMFAGLGALASIAALILGVAIAG